MKYASALFACLFSLAVTAQEKLEVMGKSPDLFVEHTVTSGENLQGIGSQFGMAPAKIATYNSLNPAAPLTKSSKIKIPLTKDNFQQDKNENGQPVYHIIGKGDNLYRLSLNYNKVPLASLKEWNNMQSDIVKNGQFVIIGFMKPHAVVEEKKTADKNPKITPIVPPAAPVEKPAVTTEAKKDGPAVYSPKDTDEGYFAVAYAQPVGNRLKQFRSGDAAIFKTVSGWTDRKYYVLINDVAVGTVIRIAGTSGKSICAKVLGPLQEVKAGNGLLLRMSNAAAAALGITDPKFTVTVTYFE